MCAIGGHKWLYGGCYVRRLCVRCGKSEYWTGAKTGYRQ